MPVQITTTTSRTTTSGCVATVPLWVIKTVSLIAACVILYVFLAHPSRVAYFPKTAILFLITAGFLLGWSLRAISGNFFNIIYVNHFYYWVLAFLNIFALIMAIVNLANEGNTSWKNDLILLTISFTASTIASLIVLIFLVGGKYTIVNSNL
uniref:MARVEL domain-containing protein n=1 Tax=Parastrongyloides trichosuri TaxID=131310 RepID=A0A0N4Z1B9_PARTI